MKRKSKSSRAEYMRRYRAKHYDRLEKQRKEKLIGKAKVHVPTVPKSPKLGMYQVVELCCPSDVGHKTRGIIVCRINQDILPWLALRNSKLGLWVKSLAHMGEVPILKRNARQSSMDLASARVTARWLRDFVIEWNGGVSPLYSNRLLTRKRISTKRRSVIGPDETHYKSIREAARATGIQPMTLSRWVKMGRHGWRLDA